LLSVGLLQTSALSHLALWGVTPDLMLLVVVSWSLLRGTKAGMLWALAGGLLLDVLSAGPFGVATLALTLSSLAAGLGELTLFQGTLWLPALASVLATVLYDGCYLLILPLFGQPISWATDVVQVLLPSVALNVLAIHPIYWVMRRIAHSNPRTGIAPMEW